MVYTNTFPIVKFPSHQICDSEHSHDNVTVFSIVDH